MTDDRDDALNNPARLNDAPPPPEEADLSCDEYMIFAMKDSHHHAFSLGLETVLECIRAAELEGAVPELPPEWWWDLQARYSLDFKHAPLD